MLTATDSAPCREARTGGSAACAGTGHPPVAADAGEARGTERMEALALGGVPTLRIDGRMADAGRQSAALVRRLLRAADREPIGTWRAAPAPGRQRSPAAAAEASGAEAGRG